MIAPWTMLIITVIGSWSPDVKMQTIPFMNKDACVRAAKDASASSSSQLGYICISSETGESLRFNGK